MNTFNNILLSVGVLALSSCSENEQKKKEIQNANVAVTSNEGNKPKRVLLKAELEKTFEHVLQLQKKLKEDSTLLQAEKEKMTVINAYHVLRTKEGKALQIKEQELVIANLKRQIDSLTNKQSELEISQAKIAEELVRYNKLQRQ